MRDILILKNRVLIFCIIFKKEWIKQEIKSGPYWIFGLSSRDNGYPILKFPAMAKLSMLRMLLKSNILNVLANFYYLQSAYCVVHNIVQLVHW